MADIKKLPLFVRCVIQNFPFIEEDFDALTNYQLISKVVEYLNKVISSQNEVINVANNLQSDFIQLQTYVNDYFDNLDVQEEINNKLDAMAEDGTLVQLLAPFMPAVNFEEYGAIGDGETDDTDAIQDAFDSGRKIVSLENKTYLITDDVSCNHNVILDLSNSTLKSTSGNKLAIGNDVGYVNIENGKFNNVAIVDSGSGSVSASYFINNIEIYDTEVNGIRLDNVDKVYVKESGFKNIGTGDININNQGIGIRVNYSNYVNVDNCRFEECHGTGACVIRNTYKMFIHNNYFNKNDYRAIVPADDSNEFVTLGSINNNFIENCGNYADHHTGVGCNGIYSNCYGDITKLKVSYNIIINVCENGIEGAFGLVEGNYVNGTGIDQTNHPTPSASGINMYGNVYRNNIVKNSYLAPLYVSGNTHSESTELSDKEIYGNRLGKSVHEPNRGIYVNGTKYTRINIFNNISEGEIVLATAAQYEQCIIGNNKNASGNTYTNNFASDLIDNGQIIYSGFIYSDGSITNITTAGVTYVLNNDGSTTFTSTGSNKAFSITNDSHKNTIQILELITADATLSIKITVQAIADDDTVTTIASNRICHVNGNKTGIMVMNKNAYKQLKYLIYVPDNSTLQLVNIQTREIQL